jgi:hypothetical protein
MLGAADGTIEWRPQSILLCGRPALRLASMEVVDNDTFAHELLIDGRPLRLIGTADSETQKIKCSTLIAE